MSSSDPLDRLIEEAGLRDADVRGDEVWARCPSPGHSDENPSWSMNLFTGAHHCFACGFSGHALGLLIAAGMGPGSARLLWNQVSSRTFKAKGDAIRYPVTEEMVAPWTVRPAKEVVDRVHAWTVVNLYRVGEDPSTGRGAFITRNRAGSPTGVWVARTKYVLVGPPDAKARGALFGAHIRPSPQTVVVEGFYQAMAVASWTGLKAVATMGTAVTEAQLKELIAMAPLLIMMDGDMPGRQARDDLVARIPTGVDVRVCGGYVGDPDDLTPVEVMAIVNSAKTRMDYKRWKTGSDYEHNHD